MRLMPCSLSQCSPRQLVSLCARRRVVHLIRPWSSAKSARVRSGRSRYRGVRARGKRGTQSATR
eukprot:4062955-Alexandrium_andersonii.AAC.1